MYKWKRLKGLTHDFNKCTKCHGHFVDDEYDFEEDKCLNCVFPEAAKHAITPIDDSFGFKRNVTEEREVLDNLDNIPLKMSPAQKKSSDEYKRKTYKPRKRKVYK